MRPKLRSVLGGRHSGLGWGLALGLAVVVLMDSGALKRFSLVAYDLRIRLDQPRRLPEAPQIAVIGIDSADIRDTRLSPTLWPWPRARYAELLRYLRGAGARVVAFDMFFDLPDTRHGTENDDAFAQAVLDHGRVVLATFSSTPQKDMEAAEDRGAYHGYLTKNIGVLNNAAASIGHLNVFYDVDGIARRVPVAVRSKSSGVTYAPLAVEIAKLATKRLALEPPVFASPFVRWPKGIPVDENDCIPIRYLDESHIHMRDPSTVGVPWIEKLAERKPIRMYSFGEVADANPKRLPPSEFKDKIVLVGETVQGSEQDVHSTPHGRRFGVLIQAMLLHSLLAKRPIYPVHGPYLAAAAVLFSVVLGSLLFRARFRGSNYVLIVGGTLTLVAASALLLWLNVTAFSRWGLDFDVVPFILVLLGNIGGAMAANLSRATLEIERRDLALGALSELVARPEPSGSELSRLLHGPTPDPEVASALAPSEHTFDLLLQPLTRFVQCESYALYLADSPGDGPLRLAASRSNGARLQLDSLAEAAAVANRWLVQHQTPLLVEDFTASPLFNGIPGPTRTRLNRAIHAIVGLPLVARGRPIGTLVFYNKVPSKTSPTYRFSADDLRLIAAYAHPASVALENAILYKDMHGLFLDYVKSIAAAVDAKDRYTHGHSQRVAAYSVAIATQLGFPSTDIELIELSATLHDVGKIAVRDQVLNKPGKLTDAEWAELRSHPAAGAAIVEKMTRLRVLVPGLRNHHERFDGKGYPDGLAGAAIPILARIIAVADAYDAMTSVRIYRECFTPEQAKAEVRRCSGSQFDPEMAEAFLTSLPKTGTSPLVPAADATQEPSRGAPCV
ncbi:MAG: CHASE2 domain-containing protein [Planctomycetes bacterium]|nr:CHASE2 domain-containing protein [Planctomycetota bacterium]